MLRKHFEDSTRHRGARLALVLFSLLVPVLTLAQAQEEPAGTYRLGAGDELHIVVWRNEDLTMTVPVRPDGFISLPLLNDIKCEGLTPMQVRDAVVRKLNEFVSEPMVSVIVTRVGSFKVSILGNVRQPGRYELEGRTTVLDALALAGGPDEFADKDGIYLLRKNGAAISRFPVRYSDAIKSESGAVNIDIEPGDIVIVP